MSIEVTENDVDKAVVLVKAAMQQAATDPETGLIDMDAILIGKTARSRERIDKIKNCIESILKANSATYKKTTGIDSITQEVERNWKKEERDDEPITEK